MGRRFAVPLAGASTFLAMMTGGIPLVIQLLLKSQNAPIPLITLAASLASGGALLGSVLWGRVSDYVSRRILLLITLTGAALAVALLVTLPSSSLVVVSAFARSLMEAGFGAVSLAMVSAASKAARRAKNLSYVTSARSFGWAAGAVTGGLVLEHLGFRGAFALAASMPMFGLLILLFLPRDRAPKTAPKRTPWTTMRSAGIADLYVATVLRQVAIGGAFSLLFVYMDGIGVAPGLMGILSASNNGSQVLFLLAFGRIADRIGRQRVFLFGAALSALAIVQFGLAQGPTGMAIGFVAIGMSYSSLYIGSTAHIGDRVPYEMQGTMIGLYETMRGLGGVIGPILAGLVASWLGYTAMFFSMAAVAALGFSILAVGRLRRRRG